APAGATVREAVTSRPFASLYAACLVCSFGVFVPFVHLVPYALDHGVAPAGAFGAAGEAPACRPPPSRATSPSGSNPRPRGSFSISSDMPAPSTSAIA
ncbi:hypothetical protein QM306_39820, partial [Burkholderia cenocepacia]|nr:hypothetical protein [Burkholderia cenocepacia]